MTHLSATVEPAKTESASGARERLDVGGVMARNTLWNYLGFAVNLVANFALFPFAVRRLGTGPAGIWLLLGSVTGYMGLLELGIVPALMQRIAAALGRGSRTALNETVSTAIALMLGMLLLALQVLWFVPAIAGHLQLPENLRGDAITAISLAVAGVALRMPLAPFQAVLLGFDGSVHQRRCAEVQRHAPCIFEYVYLARPDSMIEDVSVYKARLRMGERLAAKIRRLMPQHDIDAVIPIPDTARTAASSLAQELGVPMREGFVKNRYIGRTFIMPGQSERVKSVRRKLNPVELEFRKKNVLLVDDSIVRGTTSKQIIQMAREAGARKVYFASAAPPVRFPNVYGIDMPAAAELVAHGRSEEEVQALLGADWLVYQDLDDLIAAVAEGNEALTHFDTSCFSGEYVTGVQAFGLTDERR